jgi:Holliday junction resolvasome RuvABC endonuclease subunit
VGAVSTIGIDPGLGGALALYHTATTDEWVITYDMPTIKVGRKRHPNVPEIISILEGWAQEYGPLDAALEHVSSSPQMGVTSAFTFGEGFGVLEAAVIAVGHRLHLVRPAAWKRAMRLTADKHAARRAATERWPSQWELFQRVRDDGRAEAAMLAAWMRRETSMIFTEAAP